MSEITPNLKLPYILPSQAQKHVTHNEAIRALDALVQLAVLARTLIAPPASPADGDRHIVASGATGAWAGRAGQVAAWQDGGWGFFVPLAGWRAWVIAESKLAVFDGTAWTDVSGGGGILDGDKGDIAVFGGGANWTIEPDAVTNAKIANMANGTLKGRATAGTGDPEDLTPAQAKTLLALTASDIANAPSGGIAAVNVQAALNELDAGKLSVAGGSVAGNLAVAGNLGVNATADATNRLSVSSTAVLFNNAGNGVQVKVNKAAAADTASFLFQTGFSGRAEIGLTADDDFHFKVSANGSAFFESLWISGSSGLVTVKNGMRLDPAASDPASPADGQLWYNSTSGKFRGRQAGANVDIISAGGGGGGAWGSITGTLSSQTDLQTALNGKAPASHSHAIADTSGLQAALDGKQAMLVSGTSIKTVNGNSLLGSGDLAISGGAALGLHDFWEECFFAQTNAVNPPFIGAAISAGTNTTAIPAASLKGYNPHGVFLRSSTTANGGYRYQTSDLAANYFGVQSAKFRARLLPLTSHTGRTVRIGYLDTTTSADATDGAYLEILDGVCRGKTANNAVRTQTAVSVSLTLNEVYTLDIEVNATGTSARFRVWQGTNTTAVFDETLTTNIPITSARTFGAGIVATEASTTASDMLVLYSMGFGTVAGFARTRG